MTEAGLVHPAAIVEQLGRTILQSRDRLGSERVAAVESEVRDPSLELALELLDAQTTSIASPNE